MKVSSKPKKTIGAKILGFIGLCVFVAVAKIACEAGLPPIVFLVLAGIGVLVGWISKKNK